VTWLCQSGWYELEPRGRELIQDEGARATRVIVMERYTGAWLQDETPRYRRPGRGSEPWGERHEQYSSHRSVLATNKTHHPPHQIHELLISNHKYLLPRSCENRRDRRCGARWQISLFARTIHTAAFRLCPTTRRSRTGVFFRSETLGPPARTLAAKIQSESVFRVATKERREGREDACAVTRERQLIP
jgi:hypothetical protein